MIRLFIVAFAVTGDKKPSSCKWLEKFGKTPGKKTLAESFLHGIESLMSVIEVKDSNTDIFVDISRSFPKHLFVQGC